MAHVEPALDAGDDPEQELETLHFQTLSLAGSVAGPDMPKKEDIAAPAPLQVCPFRVIPLRVEDGTYKKSEDTAQILREIGGGRALLRMTTVFYERVFADAHIAKFIMNRGDPHASRLSNWLIEKMGGEGDVWTTERIARRKNIKTVILGDGREHIVHDRTSAHVAAWNSPLRPPTEMGQHFNLVDSRVWMRLMFWSARDTGLFDLSPSFQAWFITFIAHFVAVYERTAPPYAAESAAWSAQKDNIAKYAANGNKMEFVP